MGREKGYLSGASDLNVLVLAELWLPANNLVHLDQDAQLVCLIAVVVLFRAVGVLEDLFVVESANFTVY